MKKKKILSFLILLLIGAALLLLCSCSRSMEIDTSGKYLVIYDGEGGYLGNKATMMRKIYCNPGSKIPNYLTEYPAKDYEYTVSSLGLAMRDGYQLLGWYASGDVVYAEAADGDYVYLDIAAGNGMYTYSSEGTYVYSYLAKDAGEYVCVLVEETASSADEGGEPDIVEYVFLKGEDGANGTGFYILRINGEQADITAEDLPTYLASETANGIFTASEVAQIAGYQRYDDLPDVFKTLYTEEQRYAHGYREATEEDAGLDLYKLDSAYAALTDILIENEDHTFTIADRYVFVPTAEILTPEDLTRYHATFHYWNFENDRVTAEKCVQDGERLVLTLHAHWVKKNTVYYHYENGTGQVDESTTKLLEDNIHYLNLAKGDTIGKKEIVPLYAGHTFVCWSKTAGAYDPWNFETDVFPTDSDQLHLYAYYIEGTYTRIYSAAGLAKIGENPGGNYLLVADVDLGGNTYKASPLGLDGKVFTGELRSFGKAIRNFTLTVSATKSQTLNAAEIKRNSIFPQVQGALIEGIEFDYQVQYSGLKTGSSDHSLRLQSALIGEVLADEGGTKTTVTGCTVRITATGKTLDNADISYELKLGDVLLAASGECTVSGCYASIDTAALDGMITVYRAAEDIPASE